jgi:ferredoxin--NADP+ reductase
MGAKLDYNATLIERIDLSPALAIYRIKPDDPAPDGQWFIPGQYMTLGLNNEADPDKGSVRRPMSIASAPEQRDVLDFYIRWVKHPESDNPLTHLLWKLEAGDRIYVRPKAVGKFTVEDTVGADDPRLRVLVAAGTGLAPFTSMVLSKTAQDPKADLSKFAILQAASYPVEIGYKEQLDALARDNGLHYLPSISRPKEAPEWDRYTGRVEDFFLADRLDALEDGMGLERGGFTPQNCVILICGLTGTIGNTIERCLPRGFMTDNRKVRRALEIEDDWKPTIFYEAYDNEPPLDIKDPDNVARLKGMLPSR